MIFETVTLTLKVDLLNRKLTRTMTFESEGLLIVAIYIWLPPASYVVFLTTLVGLWISRSLCGFNLLHVNNVIYVKVETYSKTIC